MVSKIIYTLHNIVMESDLYEMKTETYRNFWNRYWVNYMLQLCDYLECDDVIRFKLRKSSILMLL
jgi:hypothetical protein